MQKKKTVVMIVSFLFAFMLSNELVRSGGAAAAADYVTREYPVMNGTGTNQIGTRLEITYPATDITDEEILKIYNAEIKDSNYNWATIRLNGNKGIKAGRGNPILDFGPLDKLGRVVNVEKTLIIRGHIIQYVK